MLQVATCSKLEIIIIIIINNKEIIDAVIFGTCDNERKIQGRIKVESGEQSWLRDWFNCTTNPLISPSANWTNQEPAPFEIFTTQSFRNLFVG